MTICTIGVDPGESSGLAVLRDGKLVSVWQGPAAQLGGVLDSALFDAHWNVDEPVEVHVAVERFVQPQGHVTRQNAPPAVIGAVTEIVAGYGLEIELQAPADAKQMFPNAALRSLGLNVTPHDVGRPDADDARDAVRHALLLLAKRSPATMEGLLKSHDW